MDPETTPSTSESETYGGSATQSSESVNDSDTPSSSESIFDVISDILFG